MNGLIKPLMKMDEFRRLLDDYDRGLSPIGVYGLSESHRCHVAFSIFDHIKKPVVFITYNDLEAKKIYEDLSFFTRSVCYMPSREVLFYDIEAVSSDITSERLKAIKRILKGDAAIIVTPIDNIIHKYIDPDIMKKYSASLKVGDTINLEDLINTFIISGYERVGMIEGRGQFSIRGGIVDFYPLVSDAPYRIELFDDEVDSIRQFDLLSQRSLNKVKTAEIFPAREIMVEREAADHAYAKIKAEMSQRLKSVRDKKNRESIERLKSKIGSVLEKLKEDIYFEGSDGFLPYYYEKYYSLFDYFDASPVVMVDEPERVVQRVDTVLFEFQDTYKSMLDKGEVLPKQGELLYSKDEVIGSLHEHSMITFNVLPKIVDGFRDEAIVNFTAMTMTPFHGKIEFLIEELKRWKSKSYSVAILCGTPARGQRLVDSLKEEGIESIYHDDLDEDILPGQIVVTKGVLSRGFEYPNVKFALISDKEIFGESRHKRRVPRVKGVSRIKSFTDLKPGDYVVHVNHGIGIFQGIKQLVVEGIKKDYLDIRYASGDRLYVPVNQLDLVQKYIGGQGKPPKIYKLGGTEWVRTKDKVKESIKKMAGDLVKLYAVRQQVSGHAFSPDTPWQKQFEEEFPYEETPDQLTAIEDIKRDMESQKPMDRLLCGDVGYGKTEVAIRAAFKAVMDGKQVAFLVPTTILAEQHYNNFVQRFSGFPVKVDMMSRFRSPKEVKKLIKGLKDGSVDILVGTHRILQKDVKFKDLGLLIIDEEQRFGVAHKEMIKNIKKNIDVLTLTATPIPRTLHMSLIGVRDMSIIETPPAERYPVQTYVVEFNEQLVRDAILREINRNGQVYFVYNRVETIKEMYARLSMLVPEARIAVGHGQMSEHELENVMIDFLKGGYDVLLSTTIIETGLDIPNVNMLIVYDADKMGLAQLYQLRGRVGRSNRLAYAYFVYKKDKMLSEVAEKRLKAIKEFTELGSGFRIAMRDLEIRGAGNLLGAEQHGHMDTVGYDMYCRLLDEAVREIKGESMNEAIETSVDLNVSAYIDSKFITDETQKIEVYKKIAGIKNKQDMYDIEEEIEDRFGDIPEAMRNLLKIAYIKARASDAKITNITQKGDMVNVYFSDDAKIRPGDIALFAEKYGKYIRFNASKALYFTIDRKSIKSMDILKLLEDMMETICSVKQAKAAV